MSASAEHRDPKEIRDLSRALRAWHKVLLERAYQEEVSPDGGASPMERLQSAMSDPRLEWLRPLSDLILEIDESGAELDEAQTTEERLAEVRSRVNALLSGQEELEGFRERYAEYAGRIPEVALPLGDVRRALAAMEAVMDFASGE